ncbi:zinc-dependent alcohol dehydrogenase [Georgenia alba]|uniref:Zinc-binding dehydrogenase n=1 Tax=Georgenia alba TaxID=2233858 RepID=A0ABW2Q842_9MICO
MTGATMRAVRYTGEDVRIEAVPRPDLAAGEVLLHPTYTGICGTDVHVAHGLHPRVRPPVTLGHEFVGTVVSSGTDAWQPGQHVVVEPLRTCRQCRACTGPHYNRCPQLQILGVDTDGSLAEVVAIPADRLIALPDGVSPRLGALVEPIAVASHAVGALGALPEAASVLVFGGGPIGWLAATILTVSGHHPHIVENNAFRQEMLRAAGHDVIPDAAAVGSGYDAGLEATGTVVGLRTLVTAVDGGGTISQVGLPKATNELDGMAVISKELTLRGSRVYTRTDIEEAAALLAAHGDRFEPLITHEIAFEDVLEHGLRRVEAGAAVGKIVVRGTS